MAKIKFGALASDARGKIDGVVYSRNQYGAYIRQKVTPVNPNSVAQSLIRERQTTLAKRYSAIISEAQRQAWRSFSVVTPTADVFGNPQSPGGLAAYARVNQVLMNSGGAIMDTPPSDLGVNGLLSVAGAAQGEGDTLAIASGVVAAGVLTATVSGNTLPVGRSVTLSGFTGPGEDLNGETVVLLTSAPTSFTANTVAIPIPATGAGMSTTASGLSITFSATPIAANQKLYVWGTAGVAPGVTFFKPLLRFLGVSPLAEASPYDLTAQYTARFGSMISGKALGMMIAIVNMDKGAVSNGLMLRLVVI